MNLTPISFHNGAQRRAKLLKKGRVMYMGETGAVTSFTDDLLSIVKSALPIYQSQQIFNQQLKTGTAPVVYGSAPAQVAAQVNWGRIALLGGAGVLGVVLLKSVMSRR